VSRVDLNQVWKIYPRGNIIAIRDLTLTCLDKEFLAVVGPSGGGKSSTLRMLAGLEEITRGEILFDGKAVNHLGPAERNIALAFESYALYQRMSVYENIAFPLRARGMKAADVDQRVKSIAELLDLTSVFDKKPSSLAGGHQQRVSLARAFIRKPNVTLLDEPISHMDQRVRVELRARIRRLHNELGLTTIYVTHDQAEATSLCDRLAIINDAELQQVGTVGDIWNRPANRFVASFIGEPAMNFISARIESVQSASIATHQGKKVFNFTGHVDPKYLGAEIAMGVRPQEIIVLRKAEESSIPGSIRIVEFKGETTDMTIQLGDVAKSEVKAVVQATERFGIEETVWLQFSPEMIHLFDQNAPILQRKIK